MEGIQSLSPTTSWGFYSFPLFLFSTFCLPNFLSWKDPRKQLNKKKMLNTTTRPYSFLFFYFLHLLFPSFSCSFPSSLVPSLLCLSFLFFAFPSFFFLKFQEACWKKKNVKDYTLFLLFHLLPIPSPPTHNVFTQIGCQLEKSQVNIILCFSLPHVTLFTMFWSNNLW